MKMSWWWWKFDATWCEYSSVLAERLVKHLCWGKWRNFPILEIKQNGIYRLAQRYHSHDRNHAYGFFVYGNELISEGKWKYSEHL